MKHTVDHEVCVWQDLAHAAAKREDAKSVAQPDELIDFHHLKARQCSLPSAARRFLFITST